jgi:hypothetical protein
MIRAGPLHVVIDFSLLRSLYPAGFFSSIQEGSTRGTIKVKYYSYLFGPEMEVTEIILAKVMRLFQLLSHSHGFLSRL